MPLQHHCEASGEVPPPEPQGAFSVPGTGQGEIRVHHLLALPGAPTRRAVSAAGKLREA